MPLVLSVPLDAVSATGFLSVPLDVAVPLGLSVPPDAAVPLGLSVPPDAAEPPVLTVPLDAASAFRF